MKKPVFNDNVLNIVGVNGLVKQKLAIKKSTYSHNNIKLMCYACKNQWVLLHFKFANFIQF